MSHTISRFIRYYLLSDLFQLPLRLLSRSAQNGFNKDDLATFDFVLPPKAEQKQIAAKLDELLAQVDTIKTRLDAIPAILKRFRQSVLAAAVNGRLTGIGVTEFLAIGDVADVIGGLTKNAKRKDLPLKKPYLRVANVYENELRLDDVAEIGVESKELKRVALISGDLLVVEGNGSLDQIGRVALWGDEIQGCVHQNHLIKIRPVVGRMLSRFALYYLMSPQGKKQIVDKAEPVRIFVFMSHTISRKGRSKYGKEEITGVQRRNPR